MTGLVYYADDPDQNIFRKVSLSPGDDESVLDETRWVTDGCDPTRTAVMLKVADDDPRASAEMTGTP
jgi:hypothetical protein